ncbi:MAG: c-type cytochrome biogenesis protein CcsB [Chloroflexi bacterium]|nr:c-type cytochrome biogenesis protein CcsB [Chloroflexota bacterium]
MAKMSLYMFTAGFISLALAGAMYLVYGAGQAVGRLRLTPGGGAAGAVMEGWQFRGQSPIGRIATIFAWNAAVFLLFSVMFRTIVSGRGPFSNMYEFSLVFSMGIVAAYLFVETKYKVKTVGAVVVPVAVAMLLYASTLPNDISPLVPALQNNLLLTVHVSVAILAYGFFAVSFGSAGLYLIRRATGASATSLDTLEEVGYRAILVGFPAMALVILLGSIWAETAWGRWWGWDPKETASLVTFLLYAGYLHARIFRGWRGTRTASLLVIGFGAVLFTYFGNLFFSGLHSYSGLGG